MMNRKDVKHYSGTAIALVTVMAAFVGLFSASAGPHVQEMRGTWFGFVQAGEDPVELASTEITEQNNRRFKGTIDAGGPHVIEGTVSASGRVNYQGRSSAGHVVGDGQLHDFGGGAAILDGTLVLPSITDRSIIPCVRVLRAFSPDPGATAPTGNYIGATDGGEEVAMELTPGRFALSGLGGAMEVTIDGSVHSFQLIGTYNGEGRIVAIGHKSTHGHLIMDARLGQPPDPVQPSMIVGSIELELGDGSVREVKFEVQLTSGGIVVASE